MNTIETCGATEAQVVVVTVEADLLGTMEDYDGRPVVCIENGASHSYVVTGTPDELDAFARKIAHAAEAVRHLHDGGLPRCSSCGRLEGVCSRQPCAGVWYDRLGDVDQVSRQLEQIRAEECDDCFRSAAAHGMEAWLAQTPDRQLTEDIATVDAIVATTRDLLRAGAYGCPTHQLGQLPTAC